MEKQFMQIGEVAERTGITQRTLRFYEEKRLLEPPTRMEGGFRLYSAADVQRIEHILQFKHLLGFTLADIKQMIDAETLLEDLKAQYRQESDTSAKLERVREAIKVIQTQAAHIDQKIDQLHQMGTHWQQRLEHYREHYGELMRELEAQTPVGSR